MLPVLFRKSDTAGKSAFTRALERFRKNRALARERLEEQRAAFLSEALTPVAARLDEVYVRSRCAVTGRTYRTLYRRAAEDGKFVPVGQFKEQGDSRRTESSPRAASREAAIPVEEFRHWSRMPCPWCGKRTVMSEVHCGRCKQWVCTGRGYVDRAGDHIHVCHEDCGARDPVLRKVGTVEAERSAPKGGNGKALVNQSRSVPTLVEKLEHSRKQRR